MKYKSCIIVGGNGFIGKKLANYLVKRDVDVTVFDRRIDTKDFDLDVKVIKGNINCDDDLNAISRSGKNIIHLVSTVSPSSSAEQVISAYNCELSQTIKLLEIIKETSTRIIFASSGGTVYGEQQQYPIKETYKCSPKNHYAVIKLAIENILKMYNNAYGMKNLILRISNPYGPGQDYTKGVGAIDAFLKKAINGEEFQIYGNGETKRDYIYIDDLCEAFIKAINYENDSVDTINIGSGKEYSLNYIVDVIKKITKKNKLKISYKNARNIDVKRSVLDIEVAREILNFEPKIDIEEGIELYYKYLKEIKV